MEFSGVYTALVTPFTESGELDLEGLRVLIERQNQGAVDGIVILGTTGESPTLNHAERRTVIQTAVEHSKVPVIVGTGSNGTLQTIAYTKEAEELGADAALVVNPYYNKPMQEGLILHFEAVHEATGLPIMLYNIPGRCGVNMLPETVARLSKLERIRGVKEASGNISQVGEVLELVDSSFAVLAGDDAMTLPAVALGCRGVVSVLSNLYPAEVKAFVDLCLKGNFYEARRQHYRWLPLLRQLFSETNPIPVKAMLSQAGLPAGRCRAPLGPLLGSTIDSEAHSTLHHQPK